VLTQELESDMASMTNCARLYLPDESAAARHRRRVVSLSISLSAFRSLLTVTAAEGGEGNRTMSSRG
jgi:hypothetical protein